jgi:menaquinone-specific isochorismate synthase
MKKSLFLEQPVAIRDRGTLPHWEQRDATYFITYRLHDSLPLRVIESLRQERAALKRHAATALDRILVNRTFEIRFDSSLDSGIGACHLQEDRIAAVVAENLQHFDGLRYQLLAYSIMPNHVHVVVTTVGVQSLARIIHSWKSYTAKRANQILGRDGAFWSREYYDRIVRDDADLVRTIRYVLHNPVKAGLRPTWTWCAGQRPA